MIDCQDKVLASLTTAAPARLTGNRLSCSRFRHGAGIQAHSPRHDGRVTTWA
ncbi:Uncharacterised protein [Mycobacteroides abscessus subsp. abscessus]|nr:hypothetical protein L838_2878 [Mycobacterium avium MAV_120709_2344]SIM97903.1 Uncharacterised protein [Mycobacteroides abscessus subsp. abscessus]SKX24522.1 Uncharacterised protein [Mycobacteroides abscessus subsp. abscessus]